MRSAGRVAWCWLLVLLGVAATLSLQVRDGLPVETDMLALLPANRKDPAADAAFRRFTESMSDRVVFIVTVDGRDRIKPAVDAFGAALGELPLFRHVRTDVSPDDQQAWAELYFPRRHQLLSDGQRERLASRPEEQIQMVARSIYNPFAGITSAELQRDSFLLFREYLSGVGRHSSVFEVVDGYLAMEAEGRYHVLVIAELAGSPYSMTAQEQLVEVYALEQRVRELYDVEIHHAGIIFYAAHGAGSARAEIKMIGLGALIGIIILLLLVYRSLRPLFLALLSISCGLLCAFTVTIAVFGKIHVFSLVLGASLIGVSIDYAFHYLTTRLAAERDWDPIRGLKQIMGAMTLSMISSLIGYLALLIAPFPGLQQLSLFSASGLAAAYGTVVCWYPILARAPSSDAGRRPFPLAATLDRWLTVWRDARVRIVLPLLILGAACVVLVRLEYNDDVRQLQSLPVDLVEQERRIAEMTGFHNTRQLLLVRGIDADAVLQIDEAVARQLRALVEAEALTGFTAISDWVPPEDTQRANRQLVEQLYDAYGMLLAEQIGLAVTPTLDDPFVLLGIQEFLASPASDSLRFLWAADDDGKSSTLILLQGVWDPDAVRAVADAHPQVSYLDKAEEVSELFGAYRVRITQLLVLAYALIGLMMTVRYGWRKGMRTVLPPAIASVFGLAVTVAIGTPLNLFNFLAMILVLAIGVDYSLFFSERNRPRSVLLAVTLSASTTIMAFGLLSLSATQAIHSFGITVLAGVLVAWLLSPLAMERDEA